MVYVYGRSNTFTNKTIKASNYYVDVLIILGGTLTAPVLSNVAATASYTENAAPATLSPARR